MKQEVRILLIILVAIILSATSFATPRALAQATDTPTPTPTDTPTPTPTATAVPEETPGPWRQSLQTAQDDGGLQPYTYDTGITSPITGIVITFQNIWDAARVALTTYVIVSNSNILPILFTVIIALIALNIVFRLLMKPPEI